MEMIDNKVLVSSAERRSLHEGVKRNHQIEL